jgi:uncharacterized protein (TIGR02186 family)
MMRRLLAAAVLALGLGAAPARAALLVDLSDHLVAITAGFTGTDVLLFGAVDEEGELAVVIRGPEADLTVRKKERVLGIWVNADEMTFVRAPTFYAVAATKPITELAPAPVLQRHGIGLAQLRFEPARAAPPSEAAEFREGLLRSKQRQGHYAPDPIKITFLTGRLFRADLYFPANVPTGTYSVEVFLIRNGEVMAAQTTPLVVSNVGFGADVMLLAHRHSILYGVFSIVLAGLAGWAASAAFRRS